MVKLAGLLGYMPSPGRAAAAELVFMLERGKALTLPAGLKVQSVPGEGEAPQKFETSADLSADASLNLVPVVGEPVTPSPAPLDFGSPGATLDPASADDLRDRLKPGDTLVAHGPTTGLVEEKRLMSIEQAGPATKVAWDPEILNTGYTTLTKYRRKLRLFGYDAPTNYLQPQFDTSTGEMTVVPGSTPTSIVDPDTLQLDAVYDDLVPGTRLLIPHPARSRRSRSQRTRPPAQIRAVSSSMSSTKWTWTCGSTSIRTRSPAPACGSRCRLARPWTRAARSC